MKQNPFETEDNKNQQNIVNLACSPMLSLVASRPPTLLDLPNNKLYAIESPRLANSNKHFEYIRLLEELIVVGISGEIKENLRTFPTNSPIEYRPKLTFSYPESEKS